MTLQRNIDECLKSISKKEKEFKAHITLARIKHVDNKSRFLDKLNEIKVEHIEFKVQEIKLIQSILSPKGSVYKELWSSMANRAMLM
jgi:2'-5' RNA ligase